MTTPSVNRDSVTTRPGHLTTVGYSSSGESPPVVSVSRNINCRWDAESRPASGSTSPEGKYGWKPCRAWQHSGRNWFYPPNTVKYEIQLDSTTGTHYRYDDGNFWGVNPPAVPAFPNGLINRAEIQALNKLKDQSFNLGQFLAEFDKTEAMIAKRIMYVAGSVRRFRKSNPLKIWRAVRAYEHGGSRSDIKKIPSAWLELQYGWKPLMNDVKGAVEQLAKPDRDPLIHCKGYAKSVGVVPVNSTSVTGDSHAVIESKLTQECWVSLYYSLNNPGLAEQSQLGLLNPLEIVWECLPYSFVVDWFAPIGPWMSSLTADAGFTFKGGSRSTKSVLEGGGAASVDFVNRVYTGFPKVTATGSGPSLQGSAYSFSRACYASSPVPGIYVKNPLSAEHVLNALALLAQAFL